MSTKTDPVDLPSLAREVGITQKQREDLLSEGLVTPVVKGAPGRGTKISPEEAEQLRQAVAIAAVAGVAFLVVVRLLRSGAVTPNLP